MSDQSDFISQIQQKEKEAERMLEKAEKDNNLRVLQATEDAVAVIAGAEEVAKDAGKTVLLKEREKAKEEYGRVLVEFDNSRRDQIEGGKTNLPKAKKLVHNNLIEMLSAA